MKEKCTTIINSIGSYRPQFFIDYSPYRNCYAHALNCMFEDRDYSVYSPGAITAVFNDSDFFDGGNYFLTEDLYVRLVQRDGLCLGNNVFVCNYESRLVEGGYKIALTYCKSDNDFHFIRRTLMDHGLISLDGEVVIIVFQAK